MNQLQFQLHGNRVALQKPLYLMMVGLEAKFCPDDTDDLAIMDGRIQVLEIQDVAGDGFRIADLFGIGRGGALVHQAQHAFRDELPGLFAHRCARHFCFVATVGHRLREQDNRPDDFIIVLDWICEAQLELGKGFIGIHWSLLLGTCVEG